MSNDAQIVWDKVRTPEDHRLIEALKAANPRQTRKQRRAFKVLATKANKRGLLVPVPSAAELIDE